MASITVVVPTYNRAALLVETLRTILAQTTPPDEIIVVDDGSTDETASVCAAQPQPVRYVRQANSGLPAIARNRGIAEAKGDWIALCDSDDLWHPRKLEVELAAVLTTGAQWAVSGFGLIKPDGERVPIQGLGFDREFPVFKQLHVSPTEHFSRWLTRTEVAAAAGPVVAFAGDAFGMLFEGNVCLTSSALIARTLLLRAGPFDPAFIRAEDTEFFHRLSAYGPLVVVMDSLLDYRVGHPSVMSARDLSPFMRFTLASLDRNARLRPNMSVAERRAYHRGRARMRMTLAYERLSSLDRPGARQALYDGWRNRELFSPRAAALFVASLAPTSALTTLHSAKRRIVGALRSRDRGHGPGATVTRVRSVENEHRPKANDPGRGGLG